MMSNIDKTTDAPDARRSANANVSEAGTEAGLDRSQRDWYKDAIVYQLHVKAFYDSNGDGIGDFAGLMQRLDYVQELGVNTIWLLPFYPSPLRDDGYDIADYHNVHPSYGDLEQFKAFIEGAHKRGIRVITELVINHTSDAHPWFQAARRAPAGSRERDFYVWSDTDKKYAGTRIIFLDTEKSNWTWDETAKAYFWHRFYSHQPDLNFDNPEVFEEVTKTMRYWLDMGVDGLRLDAVPYLCEREGTNNENLDETHAVLRRIRSEMDRHYPDRMLLAEANQWPEDTRPYFGDGDECHMSFHFPLMPRMYMALAQEDRFPITDILRQTPEIPEGCQWALFLRNHDELTLEMVTEDERDYLWRTYASDPRARINLGIRRRLAPLLDNDRRKIELLNALLLSMPGTPTIYYGDELGMGDNYYLGDRDGVRTPMQWSADRNGGFSRADPQRLYLPPIMDANFGYQTINVEAQQRDPSSLLNWMRRLIAVRNLQPAFGRGTLEFLYPRNRKVLAFMREHEDRRLLCVFNLSRSAQAAELDLAAFKGTVPVELTGSSPFPSIGELPYMLTLPAYGFFWFALSSDSADPAWRTMPVEPAKDLVTMVFAQGWQSILEGRERAHLERACLPEFVTRQRWFGAKDARLSGISLTSLGELPGVDGESFPLMRLEATLTDWETQRYFLPLAAAWGPEHVAAGSARLPYTVAKLRRGARVGALLDAAHDERLARSLVNAVRRAGHLDDGGARVEFVPNGDWEQVTSDCSVRDVGADQSNNALIVDERIFLKIYRRLHEGLQPEIEMCRFLSQEAGFSNTPELLGVAEHRPQVARDEGQPTVLAALFRFTRNQGDCWQAIVGGLERHLDDMVLAPAAADEIADDRGVWSHPLDLAAVLGQRTAEMHRALAIETSNPAFAKEPVTPEDVAAWSDAAKRDVAAALATLERVGHELSEQTRARAEEVVARRSTIEARIDKAAARLAKGEKTRIHGDYHLGQILVAEMDVVIIDFEGEPRRSLDERREKTSPLRDVAGLLRSLDYAAWAALDAVSMLTPELPARVTEAAMAWRDWASETFLQAYFDNLGTAADMASSRGALDLFLLQKAAYEISYEAANRPTWLDIPLRGVLELLARPEWKEGA
ncbi:MAG: maltose alpha-D-glucosyltransferase [Hyphomicrobiaceae bacterium]